MTDYASEIERAEYSTGLTYDPSDEIKAARALLTEAAS